MIRKIARRLVGDAIKQHYTSFSVFNEAVNFEKQCIFIAVPKTGTTSVRSQLTQPGQAFIEAPHLNAMQVRDCLYTYFLKQSLGTNIRFPNTNAPSDADIRKKAKDVFDTFFKFSAVRNPWARAVSMYSRREGVQIKADMSFDEFCQQHIYASDTCFYPTLHHNQLDWLCDENGKCLMDYVYKLEDFEKALVEIAEKTSGRIILQKEDANRNPDSGSRSYRDLYTDETKKLIAKHFEKDIDFFKYTF